jgi:DNA polymerase
LHESSVKERTIASTEEQKMTTLHCDFETRSEAQLRGPLSVGLHNYVCDPSTAVLMLAWAFDNGPVRVWQPHCESMPDELQGALNDPAVEISCWNSSFERGVFQYVLKMPIAISRFVDPQASARYLSLPGNLDEVSTILGLNKDLAKEKDGKRLIDIFSKRSKRKKKRNEPVEYYFRDWYSDPQEWDRFVEYCRQDVVAEREIQRRLGLLGVFPLPERERKIWVFDQTVNDRGMPVDVNFVAKALKLATRSKNEEIEKQNKLTGLDNANSNSQMLAWANEQGYPEKSLRKEAVSAALKYNDDLTPLCRQVFEARKAASSTSYKKLASILRQVSPDQRLRNLFVYLGSSRCGRWSSSGGMQFHNMARPEKAFEDEDTLNQARAMIYAEDYESIVNSFGSVLLTVKSCIRTAFVASKGNRFNVSDLNAIETRVGAWVAGCQSLLKVFSTYLCLDHPEEVKDQDGKCGQCGKKLHAMDPYLSFAVKMTQIFYINLARDVKSKDPVVKAAAKRFRQMGKVGVLGCIYRLSGGQMGKTKDGDPVKQGLWGFAENMGVEMTEKEAHDIVDVFRESYPEICECWYACEKAIADVLADGTVNVKRQLGPDGCIKFDKITIQDRYPVLRIQLPSGRFLHYMDARLEMIKMPWKDREDKDVYKKTLVYAGQDQKTKQWSVVTSHGGKVYENLVQGIARDVLAESLVKFENESDLPVCGHIHDEGITETTHDSFSPGISEMEQIMGQPIDWAPFLPLKAEGFESQFYKKG